MTISWVTPAGSLRPTITERVTLEQPLQATSNTGTVTYSLIAGSLPRGLRLDGNVIKGSPTEVRRLTLSRFVVRAADGSDIEDRTFSLTVDGSDAPEWLTREGFLPVGINNTFFVLDNAFVNFQLEAYDPDVIIGDVLEFYIPPGGGELPPGLSLSTDGTIRGFTDPIFSVEYNTGTGGYDSTAFDVIALDSGPQNNNGYDSFLFDQQTYDYNEPSLPPRRLSRYYSFVVVVSDGFTEVRRSFRIYVVTEEFLRADNTIIQVDTGIFQADNTPERSPIWITESNLGRRRANNYITIYLDVYNPPTLEGTISYFLVTNNPDGTPSQLPPGTTLDSVTGEIAGRVPYQPAITKNYTFTLQAVSFSAELERSTYSLLGDWSSSTIYDINDAVRFEGFIWVCIQPHRNQLPADGGLYWTRGVGTTDKTFSIDIVGEIESAIEWVSEADRGSIKPNQPSQIFVEARSLLYGGRVVYELVEGQLPPGLSLISTGSILGKTQQFSKNDTPGLTRFFDNYIEYQNLVGSFIEGDILTGSSSEETVEVLVNDTNTNRVYYKSTAIPMFELNETIVGPSGQAKFIEKNKDFNISIDIGTTTLDRVYKFKIRARDGANFAESIKEFFITVSADSEVTYSNLYIKAFQSKEKRLAWFDFITDASIFRSDEIYRYGDPNFGVQPELKVLVYAGIESKEAQFFIQAMAKNHYRKRLQFGSLRKVVGKNPTTQEIEYETIVVDVVDELEKGIKSISEEVDLGNGITSRVLVSTNQIRISSNTFLASERDNQRVFPNSFKNMRNQIKRMGQRDRTFLPLWMRSIQDLNFVETGYVHAVILCYTKPGKADSIMARIRAREFDFKLLDFEADRYIVDSVGGEIEDKYLAFPQRDIINKLPNPSPIVEVFPVRFGSFDSNAATFDSNALTFDQG
jgi:hypothetical protein